MMNSGSEPRQGKHLRRLFEALPEHERADAEDRFRRYADLALRVYLRISKDPEAYAQFRTLTDSVYRPTIPDERSIPSENSPE